MGPMLALDVPRWRGWTPRGRNHRLFLECVHHITWQALPGRFEKWNVKEELIKNVHSNVPSDS